MSEMMLGIFVVLLFFTLVQRLKISDALSRRQLFNKRENSPDCIRYGALFLSEAEVRSNTMPLHGVVDQVFEDSKGELVIVDTKLRRKPNVYKSDIMQMSAYKKAIEDQYGRKVKDKGFVRCVDDSNQITYLETYLVGEERLAEEISANRKKRTQKRQ